MAKTKQSFTEFFPQPTTYQNDYKWFNLEQEQTKCDKRLEKIKTIRKKPLIKHEYDTLQKYDEGLPFNIFWEPKPIVQTHPKDIFTVPEIPVDNESVRQTRPRVYRLPQVSIDDIADVEMRERIIKWMYTTEWQASCEYSTIKLPTKKQEIPNTTLEDTNAKKVRFYEDPTDKSPKDWNIKYAEKWDTSQMRYIPDKDKKFKETKALFKEECSTVPGLISNEFTNHVISLGKENKLRIPYTDTVSGYTGHLPEAPFNIEPQKTTSERVILLDPLECL